jgi:hypothetical protein
LLGRGDKVLVLGTCGVSQGREILGSRDASNSDLPPVDQWRGRDERSEGRSGVRRIERSELLLGEVRGTRGKQEAEQTDGR